MLAAPVRCWGEGEQSWVQETFQLSPSVGVEPHFGKTFPQGGEQVVSGRWGARTESGSIHSGAHFLRSCYVPGTVPDADDR